MDQKQILAIQTSSPALTIAAEFPPHTTAYELKVPLDAKECNLGFPFSPSSGKRARAPAKRRGCFFVAEFHILYMQQPWGSAQSLEAV
jgi:hypothetical protein